TPPPTRAGRPRADAVAPGRRAGFFLPCRACAAIAATAARTSPHGLLQVLHRPTHLRRGAVDRDLRRRPDLDPAASDRRIPGGGAALGGGAHRVPGRKPEGNL